MAIYAISDLHLSFGNNKPMDIFGDNWENHYIKIAEDWKAKITDNDIVIMAGDFSWATYIDDTIEDFNYLNNLPGTKLMLKGNHDYWWETVSKMNKFLVQHDYTNIEFLYNNCIEKDGWSICGTRGWAMSDDPQYDNDKIFAREYLRLEYSLQQAKNDNILVVLHYPPNNSIIEIMKKYKVKKCIYGHIHGSDEIFEKCLVGENNGIEYFLTACDYLKFKLTRII